ncbi:MAG: tyrosine-type recombinase/integrase [Clostridiales bacterium]|jgi:site-specific recombinase XerD|nr:tyrosine-type recombinase/integrase [Clostridiales bacterium]
MPNAYFNEISEKQTLRLRELLRELPGFLRDFFNGVADNTTARTRLGYAIDIKIFLNFLVKEVRGFDKEVADITLADMEKVTKADLEEFKSYLDYYIKGEGGDAVIYRNHEVGKSRKLSAIRSMYRFFQKRDRIAKNPADVLEYPKVRDKGIVRLEYNEMAKLLDTVESGEGLSDRQKSYHEYTKVRDLAIVTLLLGTGIRVSECVGIDIAHLDFENGGIYITRKGGGDALVYFGDEVEEALDKYMETREEIHAVAGHEKALFLSMQRRRLDVRSVQKIVKKYASLVTSYKNITPHKLRSTFGTNLYRETEDIYLVADVLGHKSVETTRKHYADMSDTNRRKAARAIRLREE